MKRIRYSKYVPDPAGEMSLEDLLSVHPDLRQELVGVGPELGRVRQGRR